MADTTNLSQFLSDVADAIRTKKETTEQIPAENFDSEILSIETGIDTSDATANANDLALNKTAYVNGEKIEGNIFEASSNSIISGGKFKENTQSLAICKDMDLLLRAGGSIEITEEQVATKGNITPEKIVKGNTIFGVEGTAETGQEINNQDKEITTNGTYTADEGYTGLGTVTVNVPQTGEVPVKLFETEEQMQADTTAQEGDLAVVYREEIQNATVDSKFQTATFPDTVVLDEAITSRVEVRYRAVDSSVMFDCWGSLNSSRFDMNCYTESGSIRIQYTSSDGITYTRKDSTGNPVDFGTEIYYEMVEMWNDAIGKFIQIGGNVFDGLFQYCLSNERAIKGYKISSLTLDTETNLINTGDFIVGRGNITQAWLKARDYFINVLGQTLDDGASCTTLLKDANTIVFLSRQDNGRIDLYYNGSSFSMCCINVADYFNEIEINLSTLELSYNQIQPSTTGQVSGNTDRPIFDQYRDYYIVGYNQSTAMIGDFFEYYTTTGSVNTYNYPDLLLDTSILQYAPAPNQFTLKGSNELLPGKIAYGKNGTTVGDSSIWNSIPVDVIQSRVINRQADIVKVTAAASRIRYGEIYWKTPEDNSLELSPVIPINSRLLADAFAKSGIDSSGYGGDMTDGAMFIGGYIGQNKQKHVFVWNELFAVYDYTNNTWNAGKTSDNSIPAGQTSSFIYTNNYMYYPVSTSTSDKYKINKVDLSTGNVISSVELPQYEISTGYLGNMTLMPSHNENYLYVSTDSKHHGCIDFVNNRYVEFASASGVYTTCMLLSIPNTDNAIELQVQNGGNYKKFILKQVSPTGSVVKTYTTSDFANNINNADQQRYFVDYNNEKITVVGTSNNDQTWVISYDVVNDVIAGTANTGDQDVNNITGGVCEYTSPEQFLGFRGMPNAYPITVDFSTHNITRSDTAEERLSYRLIQQINGVTAKQKLLLEGYALLIQTIGNNNSNLTLLNFENNFSNMNIPDYSGTINPTEYNTAVATTEDILGNTTE